MSGNKPQLVPEIHFVVKLLKTFYHISASLYQLPSDTGKYIYRVEAAERHDSEAGSGVGRTITA